MWGLDYFTYMLDSKFYLWLCILACFSTFSVLILNQFDGFIQSAPLSYFSISFFSLLCLIVHYAGKRAAQSTNKNLLTQLIMIVVFIKLLFCLLIVVGYDRIYQPESNHFIFPFLSLYLIYTIFEVVILTQANRMSA